MKILFILTADFLVLLKFCVRGALLSLVPALEGATTADRRRLPGGGTSGAGHSGWKPAVKGSLRGLSGGDGFVLPPEVKRGLGPVSHRLRWL